MILVTGGAGFIGSNLVAALGERFQAMCQDVARLTGDNMAYAAEVAAYEEREAKRARGGEGDD